MLSKDLEPDEIKERRTLVKEIYHRHGDAARYIIWLAGLTGQPLIDVADAWRQSGVELQDALHSTGKFYG